jgi:tRNA (Thr-GGU) A37 N-methylase
MELTASLPVIGVVRTSHHELESTPIQAGLNRAEHATIEVAEPYRDGLDGPRSLLPASSRCLV